MKKILLPLICSFYYFSLFAQQAPPQGINYQAMVYAPNGNQQVGVNSAGQLPANTEAVEVRFTLEEGNNGPVIYEEIHNDTTDQYGLLETIIGTGLPTSNSPGNFNQIDWSLGDPYLRVSITLVQSGTTVTSYQKLWSVPYALYAGQANTAAYADSSDYAQTAGNGITGVTDNGDGTLTFTYVDGSSYTTGPLTGVGNLGAAQSWSLTGNAGTDPLTNFIGTTDSTDWGVRTDNLERVRVKGNGFVGIGTANPLGKFHLNNDLSGSDSSFIITSGGDVGIGTTNPTSRLHVKDKTFDYSMNYSAGLGGYSELTISNYYDDNNDNRAILNLDGFAGKLSLENHYDGNTPSNRYTALRNTTPYNFHFITNVGQVFTISPNGNVGIGTTSPTEKLQIDNGGIRINGFYGIGFDDQPFGNNTPNGNEGAKIYFDNTLTADPNKDYLVIEKKDGSSVNPDGGIAFANRGNNGLLSASMLIDGFGNVGIGTITPPHKLSVLDGSLFTYNSSQNASTEIISGGIELFRAPSISGYVDFKNLATEDFDFRIYNDSDFDGGNGSLVTRSLADNNIMVIQKNGNVGLNMSTPQRTLHVNSVMRLEPIPTAPASPGKGDMYFDSTLNKLRVYDGTTWQNCW